MSVIKTILSLVNGKYKSDLNDSVASTKRAADGIKSVWSAAGSVLGFGVGLGTLLGIAKGTAAKLEDLKHASENLGMPTDEMQRWNSAARKSGLEAESVSMAVSQMSNVINSAMTGDKTANIKLGMIGLKPEQLAGLGVSEQFGMILDGINSVQDKTEKLALSNDLLGRSGKRIGALAASWREYKQAMDGKLIPESEIKAAEEFEQTLRKLEGIATRLAAKSPLIPALTWLGKQAADVYETVPSKEDYKNSSMNTKLDLNGMAETAIRQDDDLKYKKGAAEKPKYSYYEVGFGTATKKNLPVPQEAKDAWIAANIPQDKQESIKSRETVNAAAEESNKKVKAEAEAKAKEKEEMEAKVTRTKAQAAENIAEDKKAQQDLNKQLDEQLSTMQDQLIIQQLKLKGKDREAAITAEIQKAEKAAYATGNILNPTQRSAVEESAGALYDAENANKPRTFAPPQPEAPIITDAALRVGAFVGPQAQQSDNVQSIWKATKDLVQETRDNVRIIKDRMPQRLDTTSNDGPRFQAS